MITFVIMIIVILFRRKVEIMCDDLFLFSLGYKHNSAFMLVKSCAFISDKFNYEGDFNFLYKNLELNCIYFKLHLRCQPINGLAIQAWNAFLNDSWFGQLAWETSFAATLHEFTSAPVLIHIDVHAWYLSSN